MGLAEPPCTDSGGGSCCSRSLSTSSRSSVPCAPPDRSHQAAQDRVHRPYPTLRHPGASAAAAAAAALHPAPPQHPPGLTRRAVTKPLTAAIARRRQQARVCVVTTCASGSRSRSPTPHCELANTAAQPALCLHHAHSKAERLSVHAQRRVKARPVPLGEHAPARTLVLQALIRCTPRALPSCAGSPTRARGWRARLARARACFHPSPACAQPSSARAPQTLRRQGARLAGPPIDHKHVQREAVQRVERVRLADVQVQVALRRGARASVRRATPHTSRALQLARHTARSAAGASRARARRPPLPAEHTGAWRVGQPPRSSCRRQPGEARIAPLRRAPDAAAHCRKVAQRACCRAMDTYRLEAAAADPWKLAPRLYSRERHKLTAVCWRGGWPRAGPLGRPPRAPVAPLRDLSTPRQRPRLPAD